MLAEGGAQAWTGNSEWSTAAGRPPPPPPPSATMATSDYTGVQAMMECIERVTVAEVRNFKYEFISIIPSAVEKILRKLWRQRQSKELLTDQLSWI